MIIFHTCLILPIKCWLIKNLVCTTLSSWWMKGKAFTILNPRSLIKLPCQLQLVVLNTVEFISFLSFSRVSFFSFLNFSSSLELKFSLANKINSSNSLKCLFLTVMFFSNFSEIKKDVTVLRKNSLKCRYKVDRYNNRYWYFPETITVL